MKLAFVRDAVPFSVREAFVRVKDEEEVTRERVGFTVEGEATLFVRVPRPEIDIEIVSLGLR